MSSNNSRGIQYYIYCHHNNDNGSADEILLQIKEKAVKPSCSIYWRFLHAFSCRANFLPMEQSIRLKKQKSLTKAKEKTKVTEVL